MKKFQGVYCAPIFYYSKDGSEFEVLSRIFDVRQDISRDYPRLTWDFVTIPFVLKQDYSLRPMFRTNSIKFLLPVTHNSFLQLEVITYSDIMLQY